MLKLIFAGVVAAGAAIAAAFGDDEGEEASDDVGDDRDEAEAAARVRALRRKKARHEKEIVAFTRAGLMQIVRDHDEVLAVTPELVAECENIEFSTIANALQRDVVWNGIFLNDPHAQTRKVLRLVNGNPMSRIGLAYGVGNVPEADAAVARSAHIAALEKDIREIRTVLKKTKSGGKA